ncbi:MAG: hypothetical protein AAGB46_09965 [Verrucomicrobiota bacterium]
MPLALVLICSAALPAQETKPTTYRNAFQRANDSIVKTSREFFDTLFNTELPFTSEESDWQLHLSPKFKDIIDEPFIRFPMEMRYGFSPYTEGSIGYTPFIGNPFDSDPIDSSGYLDLGFKHRAPTFINDSWELAYGLSARLPVDEIPTDSVRDNFARYQPYAVVSHRFHSKEPWNWYLNLSYDQIDRDPFRLARRDPKPNSLVITRPGIIFGPKGEWRYSLEYEYKTDRFDGGESNGHALIPGVTWFPDHEKRQFPIPGEFDLGLTLRYNIQQLPEDNHRSDLRVSLRVRWRFSKP